MAVIYEEKEDNLLAGYPVVKSKFTQDEYLIFDQIKKQWIARKNIDATQTVLTYDIDGNVIQVLTYMNNKLVQTTNLTWDGNIVEEIEKINHLLGIKENFSLVYDGDNVIQINKIKGMV